MTRFVLALDRLTTWIGQIFAWVGLIMVFGTLANVVLRYVYGLAPVALYEAVIYAFGMVLTATCGWAYLREDHVRIDTFYGMMSETGKAWVNLIGILTILVPTLWITWTTGLPYVRRSWAVMESSMDQSGIPGVFILKSFILVCVVVTAMAALSLLLRAFATIIGRPIPPLVAREGE